MNVLVLGAAGYTGSRLVQELIRRGHQVRGLTRRLEAGTPLEQQGMELRVGDVSQLEDIRTIAQDIEVIFNLAGYCRAETEAMRAALLDGTRNLVHAADRAVLKKYIWASNVAVYGHPQFDARLTETSPLKPDYALGRATAEVEKLAQNEFPTVTVRVSSVYGPGRDYIEAVRTGRVRILNTGANWQSRIQVADLVQVLIAAMERAPVGETYLAGDDLPTTARDFFYELAEALHVSPPLQLEARAARAFGVATRAFNWLAGQPQFRLNENVIGLLTGNYFCLNEKLKRELGVTWKYPTFRDAYEERLLGKRGQ
jgi:nucleoside-diphosphate-sugar epimerase